MKYLVALLLPPLAVWRTRRRLQSVLNVGLCVAGWIPGVIHAFYVTGKGPLLKRPEDITRFVVENYSGINDKDYQTFGRELLKCAPSSPERDLIYALRISSILPTIKSFKTLESRWATAHCGAGASGLEMGKSSRNYRLVYEFLTAEYLKRARELVEEDFTRFKSKVEAAKTDATKSKLKDKFVEKMDSRAAMFSYELRGIEQVVAQYKPEA